MLLLVVIVIVAAGICSIEKGCKIAVIFDAGWYPSGKRLDEGRQVSGRDVHLSQQGGNVGKINR